MLLPIYFGKSCSINHLTRDTGLMIQCPPQLWQKNLLRRITKKLDSGTAQGQSDAQQCDLAGSP